MISNKKAIINEVTSHILSFILSISIFLLVLLFICSLTVLNKSFILNELKKNNYYEGAYYNIVNYFDNQLITSGIEKDIMKNLVNKELVEEDIKNMINNFYQGKEIELKTDKIRENYNNEVNIVLKEHNRTPDKEEKADIKKLEDTLANGYENEIAYSLKLLNNLSSKFLKLTGLINVVEIILSLVVIGLFLVLYKINKNNIMKLGVPLIASGLTNIIIRILIESKYNKILILNEAISKVIVSTITSVITSILVLGIILILIGIAVIIFGVLKEKKK